MGASRLKPLTVKEIQKLTATPPSTIKHRSLGGVPGFVLVHTPAGYTGYGLIYRSGGQLTAVQLARVIVSNAPKWGRRRTRPCLQLVI